MFIQNLQEELTLHESVGKGDIAKKLILNDPRFMGMQKIEHVHGPTTIHYVRDPNTGKMYDFKVKRRL